MQVKIGDIVVGAAGRASELLATFETGDPPDWGASVAGWFLQCPGQSPAWDKYGLAMIHLRPIEGVRPPVIRREGATHEVMLLAYDPRTNPDPEDPTSWKSLRPLNFTGQIILPNDEAAIVMLRVLAKAIADGILWAEPPLSGQREPWATQIKLLEDHAWGRHE